jgi:hypothetical protein
MQPPILDSMVEDDLVVLELMLNRFRRLLSELQRGSFFRNDFQPWEVDILLDLANCPLDGRRRSETLRRYQRAVEKQMETGPGPPMKFSDFLAARARRNGDGEIT